MTVVEYPLQKQTVHHAPRRSPPSLSNSKKERVRDLFILFIEWRVFRGGEIEAVTGHRGQEDSPAADHRPGSSTERLVSAIRCSSPNFEAGLASGQKLAPIFGSPLLYGIIPHLGTFCWDLSYRKSIGSRWKSFFSRKLTSGAPGLSLGTTV